MKTVKFKETVDGGKAAVALTLVGAVGATEVEVEAENAVQKVLLKRAGETGLAELALGQGDGAYSVEDNVLTVKTGKLPIGTSSVCALLKAGTNTSVYAVVDLVVTADSSVEDTIEEEVEIVDTYGDGGSAGDVSKLVFGGNTIVEVDADGTHIYNADGDEIGTFTEDGISLGHHDGLHLDVAVAGQTAISDGEGNHIVEIDGTKVSFITPDGDTRFSFASGAGVVSVVSPDGEKSLQFTADVIDAINALVQE